MRQIDRRTIRNGVIGGIAGAALGFLPLVLLVAPLLGGGVAGSLDRDGARRGALAGVIAGVLMAAPSTLVTGVLLFTRFGDLPFGDGSPIIGLGIPAVLSLAATTGQLIRAGIGGALGALLAAERPSSPGPTRPGSSPARTRRLPRWVAIAGSLAAGIATFAATTVAVTAVLDPLIWPSALVGLPIVFVAGAAVAVLGYRYTTRPPDSSVNWRGLRIGAVAVLVVFALVLGGFSLLGQQRVEQTTESTYGYRVTISADGTLDEPTFYVPLPQPNGEAE